MHVYLATTKKSYLDNNKYKEANAQVLEALRCTLSKDYLSMVSHCDFAFAVWNSLASPKEQASHILSYVARESSKYSTLQKRNHNEKP